MSNDPKTNPQSGIFASVPGRVKLLILGLTFTWISGGYLTIYVTAYLAEVGVPGDTIGLVVAVLGISVVLSAIPFGLLSDRLGRKWILILGSVGFGPAMIILFVSSDLQHLIVASILSGLAEAATLSTWNASIADQTDSENRVTAFSLSFTTSTGALAFGSALPFSFPILEAQLGINSATIHTQFLLLLGLTNLLTPFVLWYALQNYESVRHIRTGARRKSLGILFKFSSINSLIGFGAGFIIPLIATWLNFKFHVLDTYSGPVLSISNLTIALSAVASSRLSRRFGFVRGIVLTTGSSTLLMLSLAFIPNVYLAGAVYIARATLMNMASPLLDSFLMGIIPPEDRGLASSLNAIIWTLPNSMTSYLGGIILHSGNYDLPWLLASGFYAAAIFLFYIQFRNVEPTH
jgi:MFS family permease